MMIRLLKTTILFVGILFSQSYGQFFPITGNDANDFSSTFGSRNKGNAEYPTNEPVGTQNRQRYLYDFHAAIDIGNAPHGTDVYPIDDGWIHNRSVEENYPSGHDDFFVTIEVSNDENPYYIRYYHIDNLRGSDDSYIWDVDDEIKFTDQVADVTDYGKVGDSNDHLDVRYYESLEDYQKIHDNGAKNPGEHLGVSDNEYPKLYVSVL